MGKIEKGEQITEKGNEVIYLLLFGGKRSGRLDNGDWQHNEVKRLTGRSDIRSRKATTGGVLQVIPGKESATKTKALTT